MHNIENALDDEHPLVEFCEVFSDWTARAEDKGLRKAYEEKIAMERMARKPKKPKKQHKKKKERNWAPL